MKKTALLLVLFWGTVTFLQAEEFAQGAVNRREPKSKIRIQNEVFFSVNESTPYSGTVFELHENGQTKSEATYFEGRRATGTTRIWYDNGQPWSKEDYESTGILVTRTWHKNGKLKSVSRSKNGERDGKSQSWYENGNPENEESYRNGKLDGSCRSWYESGILESERTYQNGQGTGVGRLYDRAGQLEREWRH
jgi:antitoxin component YwqK of YwqJK toxin-antitoxin module